MKTDIWTNDEILEIFAKTYNMAVLAKADMRESTEILETIRSALLKIEDPFKIWNIIDEQIGLADVRTVLLTDQDPSETWDTYFELISREDTIKLQPVLIWLRNQFRKKMFNNTVLKLHETFEQDPDTGWGDWLQIYVEALNNWREYFYSALLTKVFPFKPAAQRDVDRIRQWTKLSSQGRWIEANDLLIYLYKQKIITNNQRAKLFVTAGEVQLYHLFNPKKANELFLKAKELDPNEPRVFEGLGYYKLQNNEIETAKKFFQQIADIDPKNVAGYVGMGECFEKEGDFLTAEDWYKDAIKNSTGYVPAYTHLFSLYCNPDLYAKNKEKILPVAKRAITLADVTNEVYGMYIQLGVALGKANEPYEAHKWLNKAIKLNSNRIGGYMQKGWIYFNRYEEKKASKSFKKAIDLAPEAYDGYWGMALIYERQKQWKKALDYYQKTVKFVPEFKELIQERIDNAKWELGKHSEVITGLIEVLEIRPDDEKLTDRILGFITPLYKEFEKVEDALCLYEKIRSIKGDNYEAEYQNLVGDLKFHINEYEDAKDAYLKAVNADPNIAIFQSNLAYSWEKLGLNGKKINSLREAISALEKAVELDPEAYYYQERLDKLKKEERLIVHFGERSLNLFMPVATPIVIEFAGDLARFVEGKKESGLSSKLEKMSKRMRERIFGETGVKIPGIRFRSDQNLPNGTYIISLFENSVAKEVISTKKRLCLGNWTELTNLGLYPETATNPLTGKEAFWIDKEDWQRIKSEKLTLWDVIEYPIYHLEAVIRKNLKYFLGYQEVENLLDPFGNEVYDRILESKNKFAELVLVLKMLVSEGVPIIEFESICLEFENLYDQGIYTSTIVERLRMISKVRKKLPGNKREFSFHQLNNFLEDQFRNSINKAGYPWVLNMEPRICQDILTAVRNHVIPQMDQALIVENSELRPFVHEVIEMEFPDIPVLSRQELLEGLEENILGEIDL